MKKNYTTSLRRFLPMVLLLMAFLVSNTSIKAQYFSENFDDVSSLWTNGWAQQNLSTPVGTEPDWFQGATGVFASQNGADSAYIAVNYNCVDGANTISNWLFTPNVTFNDGDVIAFWTRTVDAPTYPDNLEVRMSTNGASVDVGTTNTSVGDFNNLLLEINPTFNTTDYPSVWTRYSITISGLGVPTSGRIAFRYFVTDGGPLGNNSDYIGIDNYSFFVPVAGDLEMVSADPSEYTIMPERHQSTDPFTSSFQNFGSTTVTNAFVQVNVYDGVGTQVYTANSTLVPSLAPGVSANASVPAATGLGPDLYTVEYIAKHSGVDGNNSNDTLYTDFIIDANMYARDNGLAVGALGIGAGNGGYLGQQFHLYQADNLDSILVYVTAGYTGEPMAAVVWDMASGIPNAIIGSTDTIQYTTDLDAVYVLPISNGPLQLPAGDFVVTFVEFDSTVQIALSGDVFTLGTTWVNWPSSPAGGWANNEFFGVAGFNHSYVIRPILSDCDLVAPVTTVGESTPGANDGSATASPSGGTLPYTYLWSNGATTATINGLGVGTYCVTVMDAGGCSITSCTDILTGVEGAMNSMEYGAYPNPNDGTFKVFVNTTEPTDVNMTIVDMTGRVVHSDKAASSTEFSRDVNLSGQAAGIYFVRLEAAGVFRTVKIEVKH